MKTIVSRWGDLDEGEQTRLLARAEASVDELVTPVAQIVSTVREHGDSAVREFTAEFDGVDIGDGVLRVDDADLHHAGDRLDSSVRKALDMAMANVTAVHRHQLGESISLTEVTPGVIAGHRITAIDSVGLYVPRGRGSYPSMLYMLAVPAAIAGVPRVVLATPPGEDGLPDAACLYVASQCGVHEVYRMGGAQAIAALAYGTETVESVVKIVGPGSAYVAAAKRIIRDDVDVGTPAGPSESMIIADNSADPTSVAWDLLIEAEHGEDSQALLVTTSDTLAQEVSVLLPQLIRETPEPRHGFLMNVFSDLGRIILVSDLREAEAIANLFAPEHLQVCVENPWESVTRISNAGEILIGGTTPFSLANYAAGANAVLPTGGYARTWSGVSVSDFTKSSSIVQVSSEGLATLGPNVAALAEYEGFYWHSRAIQERLE